MLSFSCLPSNKTQLENASIQSACVHSSLKHHSSILDTAWSITIVALITKLITISLSSYLDLDSCFIALLFSSHFCWHCSLSSLWAMDIQMQPDLYWWCHFCNGHVQHSRKFSWENRQMWICKPCLKVQLLLHCMCCLYVFYCWVFLFLLFCQGSLERSLQARRVLWLGPSKSRVC